MQAVERPFKAAMPAFMPAFRKDNGDPETVY